MSESEVILKVENVSKQYRLGSVGTKTLSGDVHRWWTTKILGKEDPFLKVGTVNDRTSKEKTDFVWALRDINFEVKRGEVLGIIGKNGAGKSTLLKLLSRITAPTTGSIKSNGRMASLLEVGTGFHPELTGRENIFLNGAILGMTKQEIKQKFDEIVDFSGCALYIDTPVKRYSSGMTVRLGFAVAAFLDPEILIVDEVLAVGDFEFQRKAIGKMKDVSKKEGRTILFVSHNMEAIKSLCSHGILIQNGIAIEKNSALSTVQKYLNSNIKNNLNSVYKNSNLIDHLKMQILESRIINAGDSMQIGFRENIEVEVIYIVREKLIGSNVALILRRDDLNILWSFDTDLNDLVIKIREVGKYKARLIIPKMLLKSGIYNIDVSCGIFYGDKFHNVENCLSFEITSQDEQFNLKSYSENRGGLIAMPLKWDTKQII